jgi:VIT1/CCC1 family predicted Fe2+/Mn2+ transporter
MPESAATKSPQDAEQRDAASGVPPPESAAPTTGRRAAFQDIKRELTDAELANPGTQKLLLEMLFTAEAERDEYKTYIGMYYNAEKRASVLEERSKKNKTNETLFAVGVGVGGAIIGLAPAFWSPQNLNGPICLVVGGVLVIGATLGRIMF